MKSKYFKILAVVSGSDRGGSDRRSANREAGPHARRWHVWRSMFGGPMMGFYIHKLDLTDAQRAQVKDIMAKEKPTLQPLMLQMAQGHQQLRQLVMSGNFDEAKVRDLAAQQTQTMTELTVQYARIASEMVQVLTPEQKTKLSCADHPARATLDESHAGAGTSTDAEPVKLGRGESPAYFQFTLRSRPPAITSAESERKSIRGNYSSKP